MTKSPLLDLATVEDIVFSIDQQARSFVQTERILSVNAIHASIAVRVGSANRKFCVYNLVIVSPDSHVGTARSSGQTAVLVVRAKVSDFLKAILVNVFEDTSFEHVAIPRYGDVLIFRQPNRDRDVDICQVDCVVRPRGWTGFEISQEGLSLHTARAS